MSDNTVTMPNNWTPRKYQRPMWRYFEGGGKRAFLLWHRRSGKDDNGLHYTATAAIQRPATYWYMLPQSNQVRRAIWDAVNPHTGLRRIDEAFPDIICHAKRSNDMVIALVNGSLIHFIGSDGFNAMVGSPPLGLVFSEFSLTNPSAWGYLRPILDENDGWALFNMTPRGKNHGYTMFRHAQKAGWFVQTCLPTDTGVFSGEQLEEARAEYHSLYGPDDGEALFQQEYWCSFEAALVGAYYGAYMRDAGSAGRITSVPHEPTCPVVTAWDLGIDDSTVIWCVQTVGKEIHVIDYYEASGRGLDHYAQWLLSRPYVYAEHLLPHDSQARELGTGKSRVEVLRSLGLQNVTVVPQQGLADGINAVRSILPRCWFDAEKCENGLEALRMYRREYDENKKIYRDQPVHDWSSHASDAFRYLALGLREQPKEDRRNLKYASLRVC
jgi:hypothetical protein